MRKYPTPGMTLSSAFLSWLFYIVTKLYRIACTSFTSFEILNANTPRLPTSPDSTLNVCREETTGKAHYLGLFRISHQNVP